MTPPKDIFIKDYTYELPEEQIARYPLPERDQSKLLVYNKEMITDDIYRNISQYIPGNSLLIFNNTRVIEARLLFQKQSGGVIEIFCLEPHEQYSDITTAMLQKEKVLWQCLIGGASKWKQHQILEKTISYNEKPVKLCASFIEKRTGCFIIEFSWNIPELSFAEILHLAGAIPLPPYIKRKAEETDTERYQTIYARYEGSVASPTAGLHFTERIFNDFTKRNIQKDFVTLHVGAGTFKPVKSETIATHDMHTEHMEVSVSTIENILTHLDKVIAVGTTSLRTIETLYWLGVKLKKNEVPGSYNSDAASFSLTQWECYEIEEQNVSATDALQGLLKWMKENKTETLLAKTQILIVPGYTFKIVKGLITNFHQPQSTLLLLIAAFIGKDWRNLYAHALRNDFRFLSYGDGCLLWLNQ
jgi:S-adenosylmethionine:tRNA ribosyltransferase-isomerase